MAILITTDGQQKQVFPEHDTFTLTELQLLVGGMIELVGLPDGKDMYINEEGKIKGLPYNDQATKIAEESLMVNDVIVGPAVVCSRNEVD